MTPNLPEDLEHVLRPLFKALPPAQAMDQLVVTTPAGAEHTELVEQLLGRPELTGCPHLAAGLWLYVDELDRSHRISQKLETPSGAFWHAIMHRREGDFSNSHYWYRRTGKHPAMNRIEVAGGGAAAGTTVGQYDPHDLVDRAEQAHARGEDWQELINLQRREWVALFEHCAEH